jgi:hypothetical protein
MAFLQEKFIEDYRTACQIQKLYKQLYRICYKMGNYYVPKGSRIVTVTSDNGTTRQVYRPVYNNRIIETDGWYDGNEDVKINSDGAKNISLTQNTYLTVSQIEDLYYWGGIIYSSYDSTTQNIPQYLTTNEIQGKLKSLTTSIQSLLFTLIDHIIHILSRNGCQIPPCSLGLCCDEK